MPRAAPRRPVPDWARSTWPGRVLITSVTAFFRLEMFDRSMAIAAQLFTSVVPILIIVTTWASSRNANSIADFVDRPAQTQAVLEDAIEGARSATIGLLGALMLLASATSLSRALTRAFAAVWSASRPKSTLLRSASRWLAVVLVLSLAVIVVDVARGPLESLPPPGAWPHLLTLATDATLGLLLPWLLLEGSVAHRRLAPGALTFAALMLAVRPATHAWFPPALDVSSDRYGTIGVSFTYIALLYTLSFCFLAAAVTGHAIATDGGSLGTWIREGRGEPSPRPAT